LVFSFLFSFPWWPGGLFFFRWVVGLGCCLWGFGGGFWWGGVVFWVVGPHENDFLSSEISSGPERSPVGLTGISLRRLVRGPFPDLFQARLFNQSVDFPTNGARSHPPPPFFF